MAKKTMTVKIIIIAGTVDRYAINCLHLIRPSLMWY